MPPPAHFPGRNQYAPSKTEHPNIVETALTVLGAAWGMWAAEPDKVPGRSQKVDFNRQIRSILSENCYLCHGPDDTDRKAKLRLDIRAEALKPAKSGTPAIIPGDADKSEL